MLRTKGRWRAFLGLKGQLWYYESENAGSSKGSRLPNIISAVVAIISMLITGFISYRASRISADAFELNRLAFIFSNRPKITINSRLSLYYPPPEDFAWLSSSRTNVGNAPAFNVHTYVELKIYNHGKGEETVRTFESTTETLQPGETIRYAMPISSKPDRVSGFTC